MASAHAPVKHVALSSTVAHTSFHKCPGCVALTTGCCRRKQALQKGELKPKDPASCTHTCCAIAFSFVAEVMADLAALRSTWGCSRGVGDKDSPKRCACTVWTQASDLMPQCSLARPGQTQCTATARPHLCCLAVQGPECKCAHGRVVAQDRLYGAA